VTAEILRYAAFTVDGKGGNPAGVVLDASGLDAAQMQAIATEVGDSETAFLLATDTRPNVYDVRYFSPARKCRLVLVTKTRQRLADLDYDFEDLAKGDASVWAGHRAVGLA